MRSCSKRTSPMTWCSRGVKPYAHFWTRNRSTTRSLLPQTIHRISSGTTRRTSSRRLTSQFMKKKKKNCSSSPGFEPGIFWSVVRRVIHCATSPLTAHVTTWEMHQQDLAEAKVLSCHASLHWQWEYGCSINHPKPKVPLADPGGAQAGTLAPQIKIMQFSVRSNSKEPPPYFEHILGSGPPLGSKPLWAPWPKSWIRHCVSSSLNHLELQYNFGLNHGPN